MDRIKKPLHLISLLQMTARAAVLLSAVLVSSLGCQSSQSERVSNTPDAAKLLGPNHSLTTVNFEEDHRLIVDESKINKEVIQTGFFTKLPVSSTAKPNTENPADTNSESTITLEKALAFAGADNPTIALAQEAIQASLADQLTAQSLLLPTINVGANLNVHRGAIESSQGVFRDIDRQALYFGNGALAVGAGTVTIPGIRITTHLADAIYAPQIARERVTSDEFNAIAVQNNILLNVATRYYTLVGAESRLQAIRLSEKEVEEVARLSANYARTGQGREGDAERARSEALLLHIQAQSIEEEVKVAAAELARLLSMDPALQLHGPDGEVPLVQLIDKQQDLESLIQVALRERPEVQARTADIAFHESRLRQENVRPFIPFLSAGYSAGGFGGGSDQADTRFGHFNSRTDFDVVAFWSLDNLGFGNLALQKQIRAQVMMATAELHRELDHIRTEVSEAYALSASKRQQVDIARLRIETAERAFRQDLNRSKNLEGRPIEVLNSANNLATARQDYIRSLVEYTQAQFKLVVTTGNSLVK
jgi:outer membrane protein TolC